METFQTCVYQKALGGLSVLPILASMSIISNERGPAQDKFWAKTKYVTPRFRHPISALCSVCY